MRVWLLTLLVATPLLARAGDGDSTACKAARKRVHHADMEALRARGGDWRGNAESRIWDARMAEADCDVIRTCPLRDSFRSKREEYVHHEAVYQHRCEGAPEETRPAA